MIFYEICKTGTEHGSLQLHPTKNYSWILLIFTYKQINRIRLNTRMFYSRFFSFKFYVASTIHQNFVYFFFSGTLSTNVVLCVLNHLYHLNQKYFVNFSAAVFVGISESSQKYGMTKCLARLYSYAYQMSGKR